MMAECDRDREPGDTHMMAECDADREYGWLDRDAERENEKVSTYDRGGDDGGGTVTVFDRT